MAIFINALGNQNHRGTGAEYDQVDYAGRLTDYQISRNADGTVTVAHPRFGTDVLSSIEGLWFQGEASWYGMEDAINLTGGGIPTAGNDILIGTGGNDNFFGSRGNDTIDGNGGVYNQVDYAGRLSDYTFTQNGNGTVTVSHPTNGTDTLTDIEGLWFQGEASWYSMADAIASSGGGTGGGSPTNGNDVLIGTDGNDNFFGSRGNDTIDGNGGAYNQVDYAGRLSDYTFTQNGNGTVTVSHPTNGTDTLTDIDGLWFQGEASWYSMADAIASAGGNNASGGTLVNGVYTGTNRSDALIGADANTTFYAGRGNDSITGNGRRDVLNVDGDVVEWTFGQSAGNVTMSHATWGVNTISGIEQITFGRSGQTMTVDDAIAATAGLPRFRIDADGVINGTPGGDRMTGSGADELFYGGVGNDNYNGRGGFDQVNYDGNRSEYTISDNGDGSYSVDHNVWGQDTIRNIEGLYFSGNNEWIAVDNLA